MAVDSGRSRGGQVVTILYDECAQLWDGYSSAKDVLASGVRGASSADGEDASDEENSSKGIKEAIEKT